MTFEKLPDAFKDMKGGVKAGEALYKKVENFRRARGTHEAPSRPMLNQGYGRGVC